MIAELLETVLHRVVEISSIVLELIGIYVMIDAAIRGFIRWLRHEEDGPQLEEGISSALEFLMCGEVLKTATARNMDDYIALGAIIILRFALAFEVQWELHNKEKKLKAERMNADSTAALEKSENTSGKEEKKPE